MKINARMRSAWPGIEERAAGRLLPPALADLIASPLRIVGQAVVLEGSYKITPDSSCIDDPTGYEAMANKFHMSDLISDTDEVRLLEYAVAFAIKLVEKLEREGRAFRILLSRDPEFGEVTVRFFVRRAANPWGAENPDAYEAEEVIQWDLESRE